MCLTLPRIVVTMRSMKSLFAILLAVCLSAYVLPVAQGQDDEPLPKEPKKTKKGKDDADDAAELPKVPAALKDRSFVLPAKLNTKAKVYFIYKSRYACSICVAEAPEIADIYKGMKGKKAELVMLNIDRDKETAAKWAKSVKMKFPIVVPGGAQGVPFPYEYDGQGASTLPQMVAVDAEGHKLGQANAGDVAAFLRKWKKLVQEAEKAEKKAAREAKKAAKKGANLPPAEEPEVPDEE